MVNEFNLQEYLSNGAEHIVKDAIKASLKNPKETLFLAKFAKHIKKAKKIREEYNRNGQNIPIFLISSITSSCNLHCRGCYSRANHGCDDDVPVNQLSSDEWEDIFRQAKDIGISFIVLAGGEPMLREDVILRASKYDEILFPIFTNGTMLNNDYLKLFDKNNISSCLLRKLSNLSDNISLSISPGAKSNSSPLTGTYSMKNITLHP